MEECYITSATFFVATLLKVVLFYWRFSRFLNCAIGTNCAKRLIYNIFTHWKN